MHAILAENAVVRANGTRSQTPALLRGVIFRAGGRAMTPSHSRKNGRLYRYYVATDATRSFINRLLRLTLLAPDIVESILDGRQPKLQLADLTRMLPIAWDEQRQHLLGR